MTIKPFEVHRPKREYNESKLLNKIGNINPSLPQDIVEIGNAFFLLKFFY